MWVKHLIGEKILLLAGFLLMKKDSLEKSYFFTGFLRLWINNDDLGIFIGDIPTDGPLWVMTDIYGNTSSLQFISNIYFKIRIFALVFPNSVELHSFCDRCTPGLSFVDEGWVKLRNDDAIPRKWFEKAWGNFISF